MRKTYAYAWVCGCDYIIPSNYFACVHCGKTNLTKTFGEMTEYTKRKIMKKSVFNTLYSSSFDDLWNLPTNVLIERGWL